MDVKLITRIAQIINEEKGGCTIYFGSCGNCRFFDGACAYGRIVAKDILNDLTKDYVIVTQCEYDQMKKNLAEYDKLARDIRDIKSFGHVRYTDDGSTLNLIKSADGTRASEDIREIIAYDRMCGVENRFSVITEDK